MAGTHSWDEIRLRNTLPAILLPPDLITFICLEARKGQW